MIAWPNDERLHFVTLAMHCVLHINDQLNVSLQKYVIKAVNTIIKSKQQEMITSFETVAMHTEMRWLSKENFLSVS